MIRLIIIGILFLVSLALTAGLLLFIYYSFTGLFLRRAPFVPVRKEVLPAIVAALDLQKGSIVYEPGCGDARVLKASIMKSVDAQGIGIDINAFALWLARFRTRKLPIEIISQDMFAVDYSKATHIFCYLFPSMLVKLEDKIKTECKPGTRIISCDFTFPTFLPTKIINLPTKKYQTCQKLYIYTL